MRPTPGNKINLQRRALSRSKASTNTPILLSASNARFCQ